MRKQSEHFGPWTTGLYYENRIELSAFWRRRLGHLSSLAGGGRQLSRRGAMVLVVFASGLLFVPRFHFEQRADAQQPAALPGTDKQDDKKPAAKEAAAAKEPPFTATFSNGVQVQLIGLSQNPSGGQSWWAPDGTLLDTAPYATVRAKMDTRGDGLAREICWRWIDLPEDGSVDTKWTIDPQNHSAGGRPYDANGQPLKELSGQAIGLPGTPVKCTLKFSVCVSATPWATTLSSSGTVSTMGRMINGREQSGFFGERVPIDGGTAVTVAYTSFGEDVRLVAIDKAGEVHVPTSKQGGGSGNLTQMSYRFAKLPPAEITRLELQTRKQEFETIEFRDVSLHGDVPSDVRVFRVPPGKVAEQIEVTGAPIKPEH